MASAKSCPPEQIVAKLGEHGKLQGGANGSILCRRLFLMPLRSTTQLLIARAYFADSSQMTLEG